MARRPHILLVDLPREVHARVTARTHGVQRGSLGKRWKVDPQARLLLDDLDQAHLPNRTEQEIIVVDFAAELGTGEPPVSWPPQGEESFYQSMTQGVLDFRPRVAAALNRDWQRIYDHGGVFCVFAAQADPVEYVYGERLSAGVRRRRDLEMRL